MFNNSKPTTKAPVTTNTTDKTQPAINMISQGTIIDGSLISKNDVRISGRVDGEVKAEGRVILANEGYVKGNVNAGEADVAGTVEGELNISKRLILRQSARIKGDIQTKVLLVEEGAVFEGACRMEGFNGNKIESGKSEYSSSNNNKSEKNLGDLKIQKNKLPDTHPA